MSELATKSPLTIGPNEVLPATPVEAGRVRGRFSSGVAAVLVGNLGSMALAFVTEVCYARILGPGPRGLISLCLMATAFGVLLGSLGGEIPIVIWTAKAKRHPSEWVGVICGWGLIGSLLAAALWAIVYWWVRPAYLHGITPTLAALVLLSIPVNILSAYLMAILTGLERFALRSSLAVFAKLSGLLTLVLLLVMYGRVTEIALIAVLASLFLTSLFAALQLRDFFAGKWNSGSPNRELIETLWVGVKGQFGNLATFVNYRMDVFVVNYFLDVQQVGLYAIGVLISEALWQIPSAAALALFPRTARTAETGSASFTCLILRHVFLIALGSGLLVSIASPFLVPLIFGARFTASVAVIWWIMPGTIALASGKVAAADLTGRGKSGYAAVFAFIAMVVTVLLDLLLIPKMGIRGAALASSVAYFVDSALLLVAFRHELKVTWRSLFVPSLAELRSYHHVWIRGKEGAMRSLLN